MPIKPEETVVLYIHPLLHESYTYICFYLLISFLYKSNYSFVSLYKNINGVVFFSNFHKRLLCHGKSFGSIVAFWFEIFLSVADMASSFDMNCLYVNGVVLMIAAHRCVTKGLPTVSLIHILYIIIWYLLYVLSTFFEFVHSEQASLTFLFFVWKTIISTMSFYSSSKFIIATIIIQHISIVRKSFIDSHIEGLVQQCSMFIVNALGILLSCTKPSIWNSCNYTMTTSLLSTKQNIRIFVKWFEYVFRSFYFQMASCQYMERPWYLSVLFTRV